MKIRSSSSSVFSSRVVVIPYVQVLLLVFVVYVLYALTTYNSLLLMEREVNGGNGHHGAHIVPLVAKEVRHPLIPAAASSSTAFAPPNATTTAAATMTTMTTSTTPAATTPSALPASADAAYPKYSRLEAFETHAQEEEIHKHDRLIIEGMVYIDGLTPTQLASNWTPTGHETPKLCLNVFVCNRRVPYISAMMMSLMTSQSPSELLNYAQVNLMNTERRPGRMQFPLMSSKLANFPFVTHHNFSALDAEEWRQQQQKGGSSNNATTSTRPKRDFRTLLLADTVRGLNICIDSGLPWCLMMEEDAVVADHFIANLERFVIGPYEDKKDQISSFSLFSYYNLVWYNTNRLVEKPYSSTKYDKDRAKTNAERRVLDMKPYQPTTR